MDTSMWFQSSSILKKFCHQTWQNFLIIFCKMGLITTNLEIMVLERPLNTPEIKHTPWKTMGLEDYPFLLEKLIFRGLFAVSFREGNHCNHQGFDTEILPWPGDFAGAWSLATTPALSADAAPAQRIVDIREGFIRYIGIYNSNQHNPACLL